MPIKKYRKKPITIEAIQWDGQYKTFLSISKWLSNTTPNRIIEFLGPNKPLLIHTLEGTMKAQIGDYLIKGIHNEIYPCKPDIFLKTYEEV